VRRTRLADRPCYLVVVRFWHRGLGQQFDESTVLDRERDTVLMVCQLNPRDHCEGREVWLTLGSPSDVAPIVFGEQPIRSLYLATGARRTLQLWEPTRNVGRQLRPLPSATVTGLASSEVGRTSLAEHEE